MFQTFQAFGKLYSVEIDNLNYTDLLVGYGAAHMLTRRGPLLAPMVNGHKNSHIRVQVLPMGEYRFLPVL